MLMDVKEAREKLGLTQEQFAHRVGVTLNTVSRWERGKTKPSPLALGAIDRLLKENNKEISR